MTNTTKSEGKGKIPSRVTIPVTTRVALDCVIYDTEDEILALDHARRIAGDVIRLPSGCLGVFGPSAIARIEAAGGPEKIEVD